VPTVLLIGFVVVVLLVAALSRPPRDPQAEANAQLELHRARRRLEVGQLKSEIKREAAQARRELREELYGYGNNGESRS
jgi:hypothetical protein